MTLLGFYGIAPNVSILLQQFGAPVRICFVLLGGPGNGPHRVSLRLVEPATKDVIFETPELVSPVPEMPDRRNTLAFSLTNVSFRHAGVHQVILAVDGKDHFDTTIVVGQGSPDIFK